METYLEYYKVIKMVGQDQIYHKTLQASFEFTTSTVFDHLMIPYSLRLNATPKFHLTDG